MLVGLCKHAAVQRGDDDLAKIVASDVRGTLGANVFALRKWFERNKPGDKRATQDGVGKLAGMAQSTVGRLEDGKHSPRLDTISALAAAFDVEPWQLLCRDLDPDDVYLPIRKSVYLRIRESLKGLDLPPPPL